MMVTTMMTVLAQKEIGTFTVYPRVGMNLSKFSGQKIYYDASDNYVKEKYSFAQEIAFRDLRESENWKDMPKGSELEGVKKIRVARKKHGMITRFIAGNILYHGFVQIMQIDVIVTTFCSLNCKNCSEWIPYLKEKKTFSLESLKQNIDALFRNVDFVQRINVIGGRLCCIRNSLTLLSIFLNTGVR